MTSRNKCTQNPTPKSERGARQNSSGTKTVFQSSNGWPLPPASRSDATMVAGGFNPRHRLQTTVPIFPAATRRGATLEPQIIPVHPCKKSPYRSCFQRFVVQPFNRRDATGNGTNGGWPTGRTPSHGLKSMATVMGRYATGNHTLVHGGRLRPEVQDKIQEDGKY